MFQKIGMIGAGHMGSAIAKRIDFADFSGELYLSDTDGAKVAALLAHCPHGKAKTNEEIAAECDLVFFAVKPQVLDSVLSSVADIFRSRKDRYALCSMAAGIPTERYLGLPIIRIMPNTPVEVGSGVIAYTGRDVTENDLSDFASLMKHAGTLVRMDESLIDSACALSGCGPAYVYMFVSALAKKGEALGFTKEQALLMANETVAGAAKMVRETGIDPEILKQNVCSPGGATIEGVKVLDEKGFSALVSDALEAAYQKTLKLK